MKAVPQIVAFVGAACRDHPNSHLKRWVAASGSYETATYVK